MTNIFQWEYFFNALIIIDGIIAWEGNKFFRKLFFIILLISSFLLIILNWEAGGRGKSENWISARWVNTKKKKSTWNYEWNEAESEKYTYTQKRRGIMMANLCILCRYMFTNFKIYSPCRDLSKTNCELHTWVNNFSIFVLRRKEKVSNPVMFFMMCAYILHNNSNDVRAVYRKKIPPRR